MRGEWKRFTAEAKGQAGSLFSFCRQRPGLCLAAGAASFLTYGILLAQEDITVDSELMMAAPGELMDSWIGISRFGLVFTKRLFGMTEFVPFQSKLLAILAMWACSLLFSFLFFQWSGEDKRYRLFIRVFPILFVTAPCFAEQFYFTMQAFEIVCAMGFCGLALWAGVRFACFRESVFWAILSVVFMVWAMGTYQSMAAVLIALSVFAFLTLYQGKGGEEMDQGKNGWLAAGLKLVALFAAGFALYLAVDQAVRTVTGQSSSYVTGMMHWGQASISQCLQAVAGEVRRVFDSYYVMFRPEFQTLLCLAALIVLYRGLKRGRREKYVFFISFLLALASPFYMTVISGYYQPIRAHLVYPVCYAWAASMLTTAGLAEPGARPGRAADRQSGVSSRLLRTTVGLAGAAPWLSKAAVCVCLLFSWRQGYDTVRLFSTIHQVSQQDIRLALQIYEEGERLAASEGKSAEDCAFIFMGIREAVLPEGSLQGDVIGYSFFQWDGDGPTGVSGRVSGLMRALNLPNREPELSQYLDAREPAVAMPCYPAEGSVALDGDVVIVKLSEP